MAEGTCIKTISRRGDVVEINLRLIATQQGDVTCEIAHVYGEFIGVTIVPGVVANLYDITLTDSHGIDVFFGLGANLSDNAHDAGNRFCPVDDSQDIGAGNYSQGRRVRFFNDTLTVNGSNMGGKGAITAFKIYIRLFPYHGMHGIY